jgi:hypothetical protein
VTEILQQAGIFLLISFIYNLGLTIKPIKVPHWHVQRLTLTLLQSGRLRDAAVHSLQAVYRANYRAAESKQALCVDSSDPVGSGLAAVGS